MCFRIARAHRDLAVACREHRPQEERKDLEAGAREDPTEYDQLLARCKTSAGCFGPTAVSSQVALGAERHRELEGLRV